MSEKIVRTTCGYCSVGCAIDVQVVDGKPVKVLPAKDYPVNLGRTCTKGFNFLKPCEAPDRALFPTLLDRSTGERRRLSWDEAARTFAERFQAIQTQHGPDSVAFLSTGQIPFEEMAFLGAAAKFGFGFHHGDGNTRQCMATAVVAYKQSFGFDAPPFSYKDAEESDLLIFVGANPVVAHPIFWQRVKANKRQPQIVVIDPRLSETAKEASLHLGVRPKSDLVVLYALAREIIHAGKVKKGYLDAHTTGFDEFSAHVEKFTLEAASEASGIAVGTLRSLAEKITSTERVSFWWTMGVNHSHQGVRTAQALINLALITGNIGRLGTGANSITGQCNAMGSRLFSNTTSLLAGHDFAYPEHRAKVARVLEIPEDRIPHDSGMAYDQIVEAVGDGRIKALWVVCTNPAHSWIDRSSLLENLKKLDFLVVQDMYTTTETAVLADLVLPAAGSPEKEGTFINSERRLGIVQKIMDPPGEAKSDFDIVKTLVKAWGCGSLFERWKDPDAVFAILQRLSADRPCDISGIPNRQALLAGGGIQWPWTEADARSERAVEGVPVLEERERRLFADGRFFHSDRKAKMLFTENRPVPELPDAEFPFYLLTGRGTMHQWHTQTRTGKVEMIKKMYPSDSYAEIHPEDAVRLGVGDGQTVRIVSRRHTVTVQAQVKNSVSVGTIFLPMHYLDANFLTYPAFDEFSREPAYKFGAVRIEPMD